MFQQLLIFQYLLFTIIFSYSYSYRRLKGHRGKREIGFVMYVNDNPHSGYSVKTCVPLHAD